MKIFTDRIKARLYADKRYADALLPLAHKIACIKRYSVAAEWLDANLDALVALQALRDDTAMPEDEA